MSATKFTQEEHKLLMIPGPIEVADDVLYANAHSSMSHVSPAFIPVFGESLKMLRDVVHAPSAQPFVVAGSGTLGWDMVAANVVEPGDAVLVVSTGYFSDNFADAIAAYGAKPTVLGASVGTRPSQDEIRAKLGERKYRAVVVTHVDTSTGVLSDIKAIAALVHDVSPDTLVVLDAVCSVGSEELEMEKWGIDVVVTASQKGIGCPPGASIVLAGPRAISAFESRKAPPATYFASWTKWLPVMKAYEGGSAAYFATPPTNLIYALNTSLKTITKGSASLEQRLQRTRDASCKVKDGIAKLGLKQLVSEELQRGNGAANGMTAAYFPDGVGAADVLPKMAERGVVLGAGIHKDCKDKYFRIGHMGVSVVDPARHDVDEVLRNLGEVLAEAGYKP
ncbi:hypothetical protein MSPP1_000444 [Malassezia sp. CBS 17886]|nr:hypothetical protein MSPP1_000444 [Malassezia sp. CBS 17886]